MRSKNFMSRLIVGILIAAMSITSVPISVYAEKSADVESVAEETSSDTETKMLEETAGEERFGETKTDTQEDGEEKSTDESVTNTVEPELSTDEIQDSKEEPATETLEKDETQTDVEEILECEETRTDTEESETELEIEEETIVGEYTVTASIYKSEFDKKLSEIRATFPDGSTWDERYNRGWECFGYAHWAANYVFGSSAGDSFNWTQVDNMNNVKAGDIVQYGNTSGQGHTIFVTSVSGNTITYTDANSDYKNTVKWDQTITKNEKWFNKYSFSYVKSSPGTAPDPIPHGDLMPTPSGIARVIPDGDYQLVSAVGSNMDIILDVPGDTYDVPNDANCQIWQGTFGSQYDVFTVKYNTATQYYSIVHKGSGKALDLYCGDTARGTNVQYYDNHGNNPQQWAISSADNNGFYYIQAKCSGYYLDVDGGYTANGTNVQVWERNESIAQKWAFVPYAPSTGKTVSERDYYIAFANDTTKRLSVNSNGTYNVEICSAVEDGSQVFTVKYYNDGTYRIQHKQTGRNLDVEEWGKISNVGVWDGDSSGNPNGRHQRWIFKSTGGSAYNIVSQFNGMYLDLAGGFTADGTNIQIYKWNNGDAQKWKLIPATSTVDVEKLTLNKTALTLQVGETATLTASISPSNTTNKTLTWQSSNIAVADVDNNGAVIAKSEGTAVITVTSANGKAASCEVTVTKNEDPYGDILKEDIPEDGKIPEGLWLAGIADGYTYTGKAIKPEVRVYDHKTLLKEKKDYTLSYKNNTNVGDADSLKPPTITVTGKGNYKGKETQSFTINPKNLADADITADDIVLKENGKVQKPVPTITWNNKKLAKKKDYTISYQNEAADGAYMKTGTYSIRVKGAGNYTGERTITLTITQDAVKPSKKISLNKTNAELQFDKIASYTGNAVKPDRYTLTYTTKDAGGNNNTVTLKEGIDYKVSYQNNVKAGKAYILFQGINNYSGTLRKNYNIAPYDIETDTDKKIEITLSDAYAYTKGGCKPKPIVMFGKTALTEGIDYTLSYQNNTNLSDNGDTEKAPTVIIKGKGNFKGTCKETFAICPKDIGTLTLTAADKTWQNKSNLYKTKIVIKDEDGKTLSSGKDYNSTILYEYDNAATLADGTARNAGETVSPQDIIPAGTTIRVTAKAGGENYTGTLTGTYRIVKADIGKASVKIPPQIYTGKPIEPDKSQITVKLKGQTLAEEDYDISCSNNINKGTATMIIKGKNDCGGTKTVKFKIKEKGFLWWWR